MQGHCSSCGTTFEWNPMRGGGSRYTCPACARNDKLIDATNRAARERKWEQREQQRETDLARKRMELERAVEAAAALENERARAAEDAARAHAAEQAQQMEQAARRAADEDSRRRATRCPWCGESHTHAIFAACVDTDEALEDLAELYAGNDSWDDDDWTEAEAEWTEAEGALTGLVAVLEDPAAAEASAYPYCSKKCRHDARGAGEADTAQLTRLEARRTALIARVSAACAEAAQARAAAERARARAQAEAAQARAEAAQARAAAERARARAQAEAEQARAEAERVHVSAARDAIARVDLFRAHRELTMAVQVLEQAQASARSFFGRLRGAEARAEAAQVAVDRVRSRIEAQTSALAHAAQDAASAEAALHAMSDGPTPPDPVDTLGVRQHILAALGLSCAPQDVQDVVMGCVVGVVCPAGAFELGSPAAEEGRGREETQHRMTPTRSYAMGTYPVVQALWKAVMGANLSMARVREPTRPVEWVTWHDCVAFCERLNALLGLPAATRGEHRIAASHGFRLPTEAEWEYAARAGQQTHHRHPREPKQAWFKSDDRSRFEPPPPVGQKRPNAWGLYDMSGNVWEWTSDIYGDYPAGAATDPLGASDGTFRVVRGGSWNRTAGDARGGFRRGPVPDERYFDVGLRLCRTIP